MAPGGVFPEVAFGALDDEVAALFALGNYSCYIVFEQEVDAMLGSERRAGWLEWEPQLEHLKRKHEKVFRGLLLC